MLWMKFFLRTFDFTEEFLFYCLEFVVPFKVLLHGLQKMSGGCMDSTEHPNPQYIRVTPKEKWSWGIDAPVFADLNIILD
jgi:hypothetical protein